MKVASIDCGAVSISQIPGAEQSALQECSCLSYKSALKQERYIDAGGGSEPAKVDRSGFQTMNVILVSAETVAKVTSHGAKSSITQVLFVILVAVDCALGRLHERTTLKTYLGTQHVPVHEYTVPLANPIPVNPHGWGGKG